MNANQTEIARHKTAIRRPSYSLPISCLLRDGLVHAETSLFDYGCGHGQDIELLRGAGIDGDGWDPAHRADGQKRPADVVNLGYVINVIEDARERAAAVRAAWELSNKLPVVAAQIEFAAPDKELLADDPENHPGLTALIEGPPVQRFLDPTTIAVGVAALIALQTYVKFERTKDGKLHFKIEKKPARTGLT